MNNKEVENDGEWFGGSSKGNIWLDDETEVLIQLYNEEITELTYNGKMRCMQICYNLSKKMKKIGYVRTPQQIKNKIKALRQTYRQARRGSETDRKNCFMYTELDRLFRDACEPTLSRPMVKRCKRSRHYDESDTSMGEPNGPSSSSREMIQEKIEEDTIDVLSDQEIIQEIDTNDTYEYFFENSPSSTARKHQQSSIKKIRIDPIVSSENGGNEIIEFLRDELDKQRAHQLEITKSFTDSMTVQFENFSKLITDLTEKMLEQSRLLQQTVNVGGRLEE